MDDSGHIENGRHKPDHYKVVHSQWMIPPNQMKDDGTINVMSIIAERDSAIHERNLALAEKKTALAVRDMAIIQRDAAIAEQNNAIMERDAAIASLEYTCDNSISVNGSRSVCPPGCPASRGNAKHHIHNHQPHHVFQIHSPLQVSDAPYTHAREVHTTEAYSTSVPENPKPLNSIKPQHDKRPRKGTEVQSVSSKKASKPRKSRGAGDLNKQVTIATSHGEWSPEFVGNGEDVNKGVSFNDWKVQNLGLNQVAFDETTMAVPGCSCTGTLHQCYKWGNGGWQSACCTTAMSIYPLPVAPNKRHARVGGRKMSGSAFTKLLSRLAQEGYDLSMPLDLKDHWAKHGTNRYITVK